MNQNKILVVDDEIDLCHILKYNLEEKGFEVDVAFSAEEALQLNLENYALILLDVMMQEMSGFVMLETIRKERFIKTPVIFITAMTSEFDLMKGFEIGADDYIKKPFSINEVVVRVKAVIDRYKMASIMEKYRNGLNLDSTKKRVFIDKEPIELTKTEYDIFTLLFNQPRKVYSRDEILNRIWSDQQYVLGRTVDVNITRIRRKLGEWGKCIVTRSGYGYCFDERKVELS
ncbi:MAG: response regulator transcription factor [Salinivirgaceae bacterium]|nr:response regulator transcription factor [Salinivirgaceae bacterium]